MYNLILLISKFSCGGEHIGAAGALAVLLLKQFHGLLRYGYQPDGCLCLGAGDYDVAAFATGGLLADADCLVFHIQA